MFDTPNQNEAKKLYYSTKDVSNILGGVAESTIRYWEKCFEEIKPKRNNKGTRFFTTEDVGNLKLVSFLLKEQGMTIEGAKRKLKEQKKQTVLTAIILDKLRYIKEEISSIKKLI